MMLLLQVFMADTNASEGDVRAAEYINGTKFTKVLRLSLYKCLLSRNFFQRYSTKLSQSNDPRFITCRLRIFSFA